MICNLGDPMSLRHPIAHMKEYIVLEVLVPKTHRIPYLYRSFLAKVTYIESLFVENALERYSS